VEEQALPSQVALKVYSQETLIDFARMTAGIDKEFPKGQENNLIIKYIQDILNKEKKK